MKNKKKGGKFLRNKQGQVSRGKLNTKAQAWGFDLIVAMIIFSVGIVVFFIYSINQPAEAKETLEKLSYDGRLITESILSTGYPENWNSGNVVSIGILNNGKINETKLGNFYSLSQSDYDATKILFNTRYDYFFFLDQNMTSISVDVDGIGKLGVNKNNINSFNPNNLVKISRFVVYRDKPMAAYLYLWGE